MATYETVLREAMSLPADERELLVCELEAETGRSGARAPGAGRDWDAEIKRRLDDIHSGRADLLDDDEFDRLVWGASKPDADTH